MSKFTDRDVASWISTSTGNTYKNFNALKDGVGMCTLANKVKARSCKVKAGGSMVDKNHNIKEFNKFCEGYGVDNLFTAADMNSFAKRERVLATFFELNRKLKEKGYGGPFLEDCRAVKRSAGPVLSLMEQKQQDVANKNVRFDRVRHGIIRNVDEEENLYNVKPKDRNFDD